MSYTNLNFGNWRAPSQKTQNERAKGGAPYEGKLGVFVVGNGRAGGQWRGTKRTNRRYGVGVESDISDSAAIRRAAARKDFARYIRGH
jgi:hypothetical protein